jgi:MFS transporter, ACS family, glucarate transporter
MNHATGHSMSSLPATRVRYGVLGFACALSMLTYLDRVCLASAATTLVGELGLSSVADLRWAFAAFALAYALFEVPAGWWGDRFGPRRVLIRIVLWWSVFTALIGTVGMKLAGWTFGSFSLGGFAMFGVSVPVLVITPLVTLVVFQFLFGMGEAGAYPNITRALHNWFPVEERGLTQGLVWMAGRLMGGLTPLVWMLLVAGIAHPAGATGEKVTWLPPLVHWRAAFWLFGLLGVVWTLSFAGWFRNWPEEKPQVSPAELAWIRRDGPRPQLAERGVPWKRILTNGNFWTVCLMYGLQSYGWYFYITYLPRFLEEQFAVPSSSVLGAVYKGGPLWMGAMGCLTGGWLTDHFIRKTGNRRLGRKLFGAIGHSLTAVCFLFCLAAPSAFWFFVAISLAGFSTDLAMGSAWAVCQDIGRRYSAIVASFMNMTGNIGGTLACWLTGFVLQKALDAHVAQHGLGAIAGMTAAEKSAALWHGYQTCFLIFAAVYVLGVICWLRIDATQAIVPDDDLQKKE